MSASGGVYDIRPFTMKLFGGSGEGRIRIDVSRRTPQLQVTYALAGFRAEESLAAITQQKIVSGPMSVLAELSFRGGSVEAMKRTVSGKVSLSGEDLTVHGMDIDEILSTVDQAKKTNLADLGAFLLVGPSAGRDHEESSLRRGRRSLRRRRRERGHGARFRMDDS